MSGSRQHARPKQLRRTSELIAKGLDDIAKGQSDGNYPALDAILRQDHHHLFADSVCSPDCPNLSKPELIRDVRPPTGERLAVVEHMAVDIREKFEDHKAESIRASATFATKEELEVVNKHVDRLDTRSTFKSIALIISILGLLLSMAYNLVNLYKSFHL